jgi:hypothetical protein
MERERKSDIEKEKLRMQNGEKVYKQMRFSEKQRWQKKKTL